MNAQPFELEPAGLSHLFRNLTCGGERLVSLPDESITSTLLTSDVCVALFVPALVIRAQSPFQY